MVYTPAQLKEMQSWSLEKKEEFAVSVITEFVEHFDYKHYVSFSGGLDSTVLLHMVRRLYPDTLAVFCNTTNEYPELVRFVKKTSNLKILTPRMPYRRVVEQYGFPLVSKKIARSISDLRNPNKDNPNIRNLYLTGLNRKAHFVPSYKMAKKWYYLFDKEATPFNITSICCDILKKEPVEIFNKESGLKPITGVLASESQQRKTNYLKYGDNILNSKSPKSRPLAIFTDEDIWAYIKKYNVEYCELYDDKVLPDGTILKGETTTGCAGCGMGYHLEKEDRFEKLKLRRPRFYKNIVRIENNGVTFKTALDHIKNPNPTFKTDSYKQAIYLKGMQDLENCTLQYKLTEKGKQMAEAKKNETGSKRNSNVGEETSIILQNHDAQSEQRNDAVLLMRQSNENVIKTGATCADKKVNEGSAIMDKETKQPKCDPVSGEILTYKDKYYVTLTFDGGQIESEVTKEQYNLLEIGSRYSCTGRLAPVRHFGQEVIMPVYYGFHKLY